MRCRAYGMPIQMNGTLHRGTTTVTMPRWDLEQFLALIQQYRINTLILVPPIVLALAKHPRVADFDLSSVEVIASGAAPLGADLQRAASERVAPVRQGYGMTETSVGVSGWAQDGAGMVDGAVGYLLPNMQARIVDVDSGDHVAAQVAPYERLRSIEFIEAIPKSPSGKILRRLLRERAA